MFKIENFFAENSKTSHAERKILAISLRHPWRWTKVSSYTTDYGWCITPASEEGVEEIKRLQNFEHDCFARVISSNGKEKIVRVPSHCFDDEANVKYWFEFGMETLDQLKKKISTQNKKLKMNQKIVEVDASEIEIA